MEEMSCPRCGTTMVVRELGTTRVHQCPDGHGVFLDRADLGSLAEAEADWHQSHRNVGQHTAPMPRITPDMTEPPKTAQQARAWVETLFG